MAEEAKCIYCETTLDLLKGQGDHVIPAALGEFRNDTHFRRICRACNSKIGKSEAQLMRCGPERLYRELVVPTTSRSRGNCSSWETGAEGMPPPKVFVHHAGSTLLAKQRGDLNAAEIIDQLIVMDDNGNDFYIRLFPKMTPKSLKSEYDSLGIEGTPTIRFNCDDNHCKAYRRLIEKALSMKMTADSSMPAGLHEGRAKFEFRVNDHYFRAIAKIAFHYYLLYTARAKGDEQNFAPIRRFIMEGGERRQFFNTQRRFMSDVPFQGMAPSRWCHFLASHETNNYVTGYVRLFYGPRSNGSEHHVALGQLNSKLILPNPAWAHMFVYDRKPPKTGRVGEVRPVSLTRLR